MKKLLSKENASPRYEEKILAQKEALLQELPRLLGEDKE